MKAKKPGGGKMEEKTKKRYLRVEIRPFSRWLK